jgi:hypothetical protein
MVVDDEHGVGAFVIEPGSDRARARLVVRHEPDERRAGETDERRHSGDPQESGFSENGRRLEHLGGVEVADVG